MCKHKLRCCQVTFFLCAVERIHLRRFSVSFPCGICVGKNRPHLMSSKPNLTAFCHRCEAENVTPNLSEVIAAGEQAKRGEGSFWRGEGESSGGNAAPKGTTLNVPSVALCLGTDRFGGEAGRWKQSCVCECFGWVSLHVACPVEKNPLQGHRFVASELQHPPLFLVVPLPPPRQTSPHLSSVLVVPCFQVPLPGCEKDFMPQCSCSLPHHLPALQSAAAAGPAPCAFLLFLPWEEDGSASWLREEQRCSHGLWLPGEF